MTRICRIAFACSTNLITILGRGPAASVAAFCGATGISLPNPVNGEKKLRVI